MSAVLKDVPRLEPMRGEDLDEVVAAEKSIYTHPWTRGSYASYLVGQRTAFGGAEGGAVGGLHFAGEHCSRYAQGFMEGGCETGERAARAIAEARGRRMGSAQMLEPRRLVTPSVRRAARV